MSTPRDSRSAIGPRARQGTTAQRRKGLPNRVDNIEIVPLDPDQRKADADAQENDR